MTRPPNLSPTSVLSPGTTAAFLGSVLLTTLGPSAAAEGIRAPTTGAFGLGTTGGRIAFVDDASAVFHNPANLVDLPRWEASLEPTFVHHSVRYESPGGATQDTSDPWKILPHFFAGGPIGDGRFALGLGVSVPYGLSVDWDPAPTDPLRYTAPRFVELKAFNFNPTAAIRLTDTLDLGVGLDAMWSELTLSQYSYFGPGIPDGGLRAKGSGQGVSANAGVTWKIAPHHRLALTVRAPMDVDYDGDFRLTGVPLAPDGKIVMPFASKIRFPTIVAVGYGVELTDHFRLEANAEWLEFSRFESLPLDLPAPVPGVPAAIPQDWQDTFTAGLGATWKVGDGWQFRGSYQFFQTPVPDRTFSPAIPDANQHAVSAGVGYRQGRHRFDVAYSRVFYEDRNIQTDVVPAYNGRYEIAVHLVSFGYGLSF